MRLFFMMAFLAATTAHALELDTLKRVELQNVQVVSTRASNKTPIAFTNMNKEQLKAVNYGQDIPYLLSLTPSVTMTSDAGNGIGYTSLRVRGTDPSRINIQVTWNFGNMNNKKNEVREDYQQPSPLDQQPPQGNFQNGNNGAFQNGNNGAGGGEE